MVLLCMLILPVVNSLGQEGRPASTNIFFMDVVVVTSSGTAPLAESLVFTRALLDEEDLQLKLQSSLGDTLIWEPGVSSSSYGPGSSRPVIRGFSGNRVKVLNDGIGTGDISDTSPDHGVSIEPLLTRNVEIIRGPATLLHGGAAIGGVVNVESKNIPKTPSARTVEGATSLRYGSVSNERTGVIATTVGNEHVALQVNGLLRRAEDYKIPGLARTPSAAGTMNPKGELPNTFVNTDTLSLGGAWFFEKGRIGVSYTVFDSNYGVPFHGGAHVHLGVLLPPVEPDVSIDLSQRRFDIDFDLYKPVEGIEKVTYRAGVSQYEHAELEGQLLGTFFEKEEFDNRIQIDHAPVKGIYGGIGASLTRNHLESSGPETNTPESFTRNFALYQVENFELGKWHLQAGGRVEMQDVEVVGRRNRRINVGYDALSAAVGLSYNFTDSWKVTGSWTFAQRPPSTGELFANGPHLATGTYEIGGYYDVPGLPEGGGLDIEQSKSLEFTLEKSKGRVTGSFTVFQYNFDNYIFLSSLGPGWEIRGLPIYRHVEREAKFRGLEMETTFHLLPEDHIADLHITMMVDTVQADDITENTPLPHTPPVRWGGRLEYDIKPWHFGMEWRRVEPMSRLQRTFETATKGYQILNADVRWTHEWGKRATSIFIKGSNLANAEARNHVSVIKDVAPLPGRNVTVGMTVHF